jgi:HPt (histidine-containing phosphotransfer) domain-containing protein
VTGQVTNEQQDTAALLALKHLDAGQGIEYIGGNPDAYRKQLLRFYDHYADAAEVLQKTIAEQGLDAAKSYCHILKGVSGTIGATMLASCVSEFDALLKQGEQPENSHFIRLQQHLSEVREEIEGLASVSAAEPVAPLAMDQLSVKLKQLALSLVSDLGEAQLQFDELRSGLAGSDLADCMEEIATAMEKFETDEALVLVNTLQDSLEKQ